MTICHFQPVQFINRMFNGKDGYVFPDIDCFVTNLGPRQIGHETDS